MHDPVHFTTQIAITAIKAGGTSQLMIIKKVERIEQQQVILARSLAPASPAPNNLSEECPRFCRAKHKNTIDCGEIIAGRKEHRISTHLSIPLLKFWQATPILT